MFDSLWSKLDDKELGAKIKNRTELFLGARGFEGLQAMILDGINSVVQAANALKRAQLSVILDEDMIELSILLGENDDFSNWGVDRNVISFTNLTVIKNLSTSFRIEIQDQDQNIIKEYQDGELVMDQSKETILTEEKITVTFVPDYRLFGFKLLPYYIYYDYCQQLAMLNSGLGILLEENGKQTNDDSQVIESFLKQKNIFLYPEGLVTYLAAKDDCLCRRGRAAHFKVQYEEAVIEIAVSRNDQARIADSFANNERTFAGGTHLEGFLTGAVEALNKFLEEQNNVGYYDVPMFNSRFDYAISVHLPVPKYAGVTKRKLRNNDIYDLVKNFTEKEFLTHLRRFPVWYRG